VIDGYEYAGISPKHHKRLELYKKLDGIWFTAAVQSASDTAPINILLTFHRINARKVLGRVRRGYLKEGNR